MSVPFQKRMRYYYPSSSKQWYPCPKASAPNESLGKRWGRVCQKRRAPGAWGASVAGSPRAAPSGVPGAGRIWRAACLPRSPDRVREAGHGQRNGKETARDGQADERAPGQSCRCRCQPQVPSSPPPGCLKAPVAPPRAPVTAPSPDPVSATPSRRATLANPPPSDPLPRGVWSPLGGLCAVTVRSPVQRPAGAGRRRRGHRGCLAAANARRDALPAIRDELPATSSPRRPPRDAFPLPTVVPR